METRDIRGVNCKAVEVLDTTDGACSSCFAWGKEVYAKTCDELPCMSFERSDNKNVIFVKIEEK